MKRTMALLVVTSISSLGGAQDRPVPSSEKVVYQDAAVRVVRMTVPLPPHQTTPLGDHLHAVMIPLGRPVPPVSWITPATRTIENREDNPEDVLLVELKTTTPASNVVIPTTAPPQGFDIIRILDNEYAWVSAYRLAPGAREPNPHSHPFEVVLIHLTSNDMEGAGPGKERRRSARGDVSVIPANVTHAFANVGSAPAEFLYVQVK
jgi:quercetin dioxygenase-like cupin family protein